MRASVNQVEYHIGPEHVDDVIKKHDASAPSSRVMQAAMFRSTQAGLHRMSSSGRAE